MNWDKYDNWRLSTPYDNIEDIEVFKAEKYDFYTTDYDSIVKFDLEMINAEKLDYSEYDSQGEFLEEYSENLADDLELQTSECDAIEALKEYEQSEKEYALECRAEQLRDERRYND